MSENLGGLSLPRFFSARPPAPLPLRWTGRQLILLDQRLLPGRISYFRPADYRATVRAIRTLAVRGAPLIGIAAAFSLAQEARRNPDRRHLRRAARALKHARPTAVNLTWAIERLERRLGNESLAPRALAAALEQEALAILRVEKTRSLSIARFGAPLICSGARVLTICNAGRLAAPGLGTALAPIYLAHAQGRDVAVFVPETRPLLQGSRLTAFELSRAGISCTVLTDSMVAHVMPDVDLVLVGADRIAANGDFANKVGTFQMSLLARHFRRPFYAVAPVSTFDFSTRTGQDIPIEQRDPRELKFCRGARIAPDRARFRNPAFDVTPARLVTGIITDQGIVRPPFRPGIARLCCLTRSADPA
jgi:methylthioribose-1-phosphate isomerase